MASLQESQLFRVRPGTIDRGKDYEVYIAALLCLRSVTETTQEMWLKMNADGYKAFDDIVLYRKDKDSNIITYLIQLKHKVNRAEIEFFEFTREKGNFELKRYFDSVKKVNETLDLENATFVLFTNRKTAKSGLLKQPDDYFSREKLKFLSTSDDIFQFDYDELPEELKTDEIKTYCRNMFLLSGQVSVGDELKRVVSEQLKNVTEPLELSSYELYHISERFVSFVVEWSKGELGGFYRLTKEILLQVLGEMLFDSYMVKPSRPDSTFSNNSFDIWNEMLENFSMIVVDSDDTVEQFLNAHNYTEVKKYAKSCEYQLMDFNTIKKDIHKSITNSESTSLPCVYEYLWKTRRQSLILQVKNEGEIININNILELCGRFYKIVILNKCGDKIENISTWTTPLLTFKDLTNNLQQKIKDCPVTLQGRKSTVTLGQYSVRDSVQSLKVQHIIHILSCKFNIGNRLKPLTNFFIQRSLEKIWLKAKVLEVSSERFVIKCKSKSAFRVFLKKNQINIAQEQILYLDNNQNPPERDLTFKVISVPFEYNLFKLRIADCHYLFLHKEENLEWLSSYASMKNISSYVRKSKYRTQNSNASGSSHINLENAVPLLISAYPGMGKSVLMDFIALNVPDNIWVVRVNLGEHFKYFDDKFWNLETLECLMYFSKKQLEKVNFHKDLDLAVFECHLKAKSVLMLFDGFDEVSSDCQEKVMRMMKAIRDYEYVMCITTRPVMKIQLEKFLETLAITIDPFTEVDQEYFLVKYLNEQIADISISKPNLLKEFAVKLLHYSKINLNDDDQQFTGVPLQIQMLADAFVLKCKEYLQGHDFENEHFDLIDLYHKFIQNKTRIACERSGCVLIEVLNHYKQTRLNYALKLLFAPKDVESLINETIMQNSDLGLLLLLQADGIIVFENSNVNFAHRTFAEYLVAKWLSENINGEHKHTTKKLLKATFQPGLAFTRSMFDRILAKDCSLLTAVICRQVEQVARIINCDKEALNQIDNGGRSLLHLVAAWGVQHPFTFFQSNAELDNLRTVVPKDEMVKILKLIINNTNVLHNRRDELLNYTPLDYAIDTGSLFIADEISSRLEDFQDCIFSATADTSYIKPYMKRFSYGSLGSLLLRQSVVSAFNVSLEEVAACGYTPLHVSVISGEFRDNSSSHFVEFINEKDCTGKTPLHWAAARGSVTCVSWLLSNGALVDVKDDTSRTALHYAHILFKDNQTNIIRLLLDKKANISIADSEGKTALHYAVHYNITKALKLLLESGSELILQKALSTMDNDDIAPLHYASEKGHLGSMELLVQYGKDMELADTWGLTALHWAATNGHKNAVQFLLDGKADVKARDQRYGRTAVILASQNGHVDIVRLLVSYEADVHVADIKNWTALHWAARKGHVDVLEFLLDQSADIEAEDTELQTPLHWAAYMGHVDAVKGLLARGANLEAKTKKGLTPFRLAAEENHVEVQAALSEATILGDDDHDGLVSLHEVV